MKTKSADLYLKLTIVACILVTVATFGVIIFADELAATSAGLMGVAIGISAMVVAFPGAVVALTRRLL